MEQVLRHKGNGELESVTLPEGGARILAVVHRDPETFRLALKGGSYVDVTKAEARKKQYAVGGIYGAPEQAAQAEKASDSQPSAEDLDAVEAEKAAAAATAEKPAAANASRPTGADLGTGTGFSPTPGVPFSGGLDPAGSEHPVGTGTAQSQSGTDVQPAADAQNESGTADAQPDPAAHAEKASESQLSAEE